MTKTTETTTEKRVQLIGLEEEYRIALRLWTEARALYPSDSPEVASATEILDALEFKLDEPARLCVQTKIKPVNLHV